jgi:transcriptional regulator GlxA family with amidase domain
MVSVFVLLYGNYLINYLEINHELRKNNQTKFLTAMNRSFDHNLEQLLRAKKIIEENLDQAVCQLRVWKLVAMGDGDFARKFKKLFGTTAREYQLRLRIKHAKMWLSETNETICEIAGKLGYKESSNFGNLFKKHVGLPPATWRSVSQEETF